MKSSISIGSRVSKKLVAIHDVLLQGIVDKFPAIHGVELVEVERSLTNEQMQAATEDANVELAELSNSLDEYLEQQGKPKH
jgi:hypothetical protein